MYSGFSTETQQFLWEIRFNNNKPWFLDHKQIYLDTVYEPMKELAGQVYEAFEDKHGLGLDLHVSRIYRDARRLHGRGPYKENLWFTLRRETKDWTETPVFFFEITPEGGEYGMGCYRSEPRAMERFRQRADANPAELLGLIQDFQNQKVFGLYGEEYKRPKGERPEPIGSWYNKKELGFSRALNWGRELRSKSLPESMVEHFSLLVPLYQYFEEFSKRDER